MKLKQRPEDFSVKESFRFDEVEGGRYRVYLMDKQKLSTFEALARIRERFGLKPDAISYCGLKDKQGRTEQLIAVEAADVDMQDDDLRLKFLGRTGQPLSARNTTSNRFAVTVRQVSRGEIGAVTMAAAEVGRLGVVNYFDSQRFGSLKHGQGFIAKDLIRGDFERALWNYMAVPSELDRTEDAKVKAFWAEHWGKFGKSCPFPANKKYARILHALREAPGDFVQAFLQIDSDYRALLLFTYQSYLWNEGVRRMLQNLMPREHLFVMPYQAGTLLFHKDATPEALEYLRHATFPLLAPDSTFTDPRAEEAVKWVLGREKLSLAQLRLEASGGRLFFKHEERKVLVYPQKLVLGRPGPDELNRGSLKVNVAFTLPPGSYATLVVKRLFHTTWREESHDEVRAAQADKSARAEERAARERELAEHQAPARAEARALQPDRTRGPQPDKRRPSEGPPAEKRAPTGFRERQKVRKLQRSQNRSAAKAPKSQGK